MAYELWKIRSGTFVAAFMTEGEALGLVRDALLEHGEDYVLNLVLTREEPDGRTVPMSAARRLIDRARRSSDRGRHDRV